MNAVRVLAQHQTVDDWPRETCLCGADTPRPDEHEAKAEHQLDALKAAGFAVIDVTGALHSIRHARQMAAAGTAAAAAADTSPAMEDSAPTAIAPGAAPSPAGIQHIPGAATTGRTGHTRSALVTAAANQLEVWRKNFDLELSRDEYLAELIPELRHLATEIAADGD